jgi:hypothetical protein
MLRFLALAPLLFATSLLAEEDDIQQALKKRIESSERVLRLTEKLQLPRAIELDAEAELAEARLDAAADRLERMKLLIPIVRLCRERVEAAQEAERRGRAIRAQSERARFAWLRARLRTLRILDEDPDELDQEEEHIRGRRKYSRLIAREALGAAQHCEEALEAERDAGTTPVAALLQAIDDVLDAQLELAEDENQRRAAMEARVKALTELYPKAKYRAEFALGGSEFAFGEVKDALLRGKIALALANGAAHNGRSDELRELRELRLELLMKELRLMPGEVQARAGSVRCFGPFVETVLDCPPEYMTPDQRRLLAAQLAWALSLIEEALAKVSDKDHAELLELELARLAVLDTKVEIWNLRRSAAEPPPPKVLPDD